MKITRQVDLTAFNSFGIASRAMHYAEIKQPEDLTEALDYAQQHNLPIRVLGEGSNILFLNDYPGLLLRMVYSGVEKLDEANFIRAAAGENWHKFVSYCMKEGLHGLENLALIPGTIGAAPIQNIGAYGVELDQFVHRLEVFDLSRGERLTLTPAECDFAYRDSLFKHEAGRHLVVLALTLQLNKTASPHTSYAVLHEELQLSSKKTNRTSPLQVFDAVCKIRRRKLPDPATIGNAGSFFKNPVISRTKYQKLITEFAGLPAYDTDDEDLVKLPAAWLLDKLDWKGKRRGQAGVHKDHALVLINLGNASGEDIFLLAQEMSSSVLNHFGIALDTEVRII